ncbi:DUF4156 domain-containing protein [Avibacterium paragallinarum]|uniref:DUF4156 domain-containing protein n=1 Tax=Avibacterium paragallinarum TaxID=728 RepID=UPI000F616D2E|nr:DUF4156 domain-containing protein [Avibacterium paragallinarum]
MVNFQYGVLVVIIKLESKLYHNTLILWREKMRKAILKLILTSSPILLSGCVSFPEYRPIQLTNEAKSITTTDATPYGCKSLGDIEGEDMLSSQEMAYQVTFEMLRKSAFNDLRNNAVHIVGANKLGVLKINSSRKSCFTKDCQPVLPKSYWFSASVFSCGDK